MKHPMNPSHALNTQSGLQVLNAGKKFLKEHNIPSHALDAEVLFMAATGMTRVQMLLQNEDIVSTVALARFLEFLQQRSQHKPVAYITHKVEFMSLDFYVDERVLIPRPDTEILVEEILPHLHSGTRVLELCTGSGCIAIALTYYNPQIYVTAVDISPKALEVAKKNAKQLGVANRIQWVMANAMDATVFASTRYDIVCANPPYIPHNVVETLDANVRDYEPSLALDGGKDGLDFYKAITKNSPLCLQAGGRLFYEIGHDQGMAVHDLLVEHGFTSVVIQKDLAAFDRVVSGLR